MGAVKQMMADVEDALVRLEVMEPARAASFVWDDERGGFTLNEEERAGIVAVIGSTMARNATLREQQQTRHTCAETSSHQGAVALRDDKATTPTISQGTALFCAIGLAAILFLI